MTSAEFDVSQRLDSLPEPRMQGLVAADDPDLRQSLSDLSRLASAAMALPDMLTNIAEFAVQAIPGADGAGLTLMEHDRPDTVVANADFVGEIDAIQYDLGEGPSLTAVAEGRTVRSGSLSTAPAWPPQAMCCLASAEISLGHIQTAQDLVDGPGRRDRDAERVRPRQGRRLRRSRHHRPQRHM